MRDQKALYFIAAFLGFLVLYCLMNHREGFQNAGSGLKGGKGMKINILKTQPGVVTQL